MCNLEKNNQYNWVGIACPASWMKSFHEKMTYQGKAKPLIDLILKDKIASSLQFYFIDESGYPLDLNWEEFIKKGMTYFK